MLGFGGCGLRGLGGFGLPEFGGCRVAVVCFYVVGWGALGFDWMWWFALGGVGLSRLWIFVLVTDWVLV